MNVTADDFRKHFALLSDEALLATNRGDLVAVAQACYDEELANRGLNEADETVAEEAEALPEPSHEGDEGFVTVATYTVADEVRMARGLLQMAEIPSIVESEPTALGAMRLMVPAAMVEEALEILNGEELSEEELAAQAEAAGSEQSEDDEPAA